MRKKTPELREAFIGRFTEHHAFLLTKMLARIDQLSADIADLERAHQRPDRPSGRPPR
ncbi:hypothetical protein [Humibacillus xanthopallidus]|uniref:hypothetical protein n=1 Tax=Humibacillus xanthopallidus TaxID=412689 RepID=UPI00163A4580|nr:hypothetical protein [Humibacillus xanthopallidus]